MTIKLVIYDKGNSHPALTYKGERVIAVRRDGSMYLSRILSKKLSLYAGNRLYIARDEDRPKDRYMLVLDGENGLTTWNDPCCARFSSSFIADMILDVAEVEKCVGFMVTKELVNMNGRLCYQIVLDNPIPKGVSVGTTGTKQARHLKEIIRGIRRKEEREPISGCPFFHAATGRRNGTGFHFLEQCVFL